MQLGGVAVQARDRILRYVSHTRRCDTFVVRYLSGWLSQTYSMLYL